MVKMIQVTKAGAEFLPDEEDLLVSVNADNINVCRSALEDEIGNTKIVFNDGTGVFVQETQDQLIHLINS